jgi:glycosyltransferase involved in cell wall biosynthesis
MRIALFNIMMPHIRGGAEILVDDLAEQLQAYGHQVILFRLPFPFSFEAPLVAAIESARMLCFDEFDRVIAFKFPAYCVQHREKVLWMFHQFRQVYDLWGKEHGFQPTPTGLSMRSIVKAADDSDIPLARHVYTNAQEVSNRLKEFNNIDSTVLPPPLKKQELYYTESTGDYLFYPSRITSLKRQHLAIQAMCHVKSGVRLIVTGVAEGGYLEQLQRIIRENHLEKRIELRNEWISDEDKRRLFANALGVVYIPFGEDSYGFVSMEAFYSAKPVIACTDSGGTKEIIEDGINGFVTSPDPASIAGAMDRLYEDRQRAERMGRAGLEEITRRDITWSSTIQRLLS